MVAVKRGGKRVGYIRVSSVDQNEVRQLQGVDLDKRFSDKCSGKDVDRPQLQLALDYVREGDVFVVHSMDRLARNMGDLEKIVKALTDKGVTVEFVSERLTFSGEDDKYAQLMLHILGGVAQFERALIRERQREGIAQAKKAGVYKGRKRSLTDVEANELRQRVACGEKKAELSRVFGISRETVYQYISREA
jgi:DNA invertase Pin-like site-specific DNA recombinase